MKPNLNALGKIDYVGLLLLRLGAGTLAAYHGFPMLKGGPDVWKEIGASTQIAHFDPILFTAAGGAAAIIQVIGGLFLAIGLFTRATAILMTIVVAFAFANIAAQANFDLEFFAYLQLLLLYFGLFFTGPGRLSFDRKGI